MAEDTKEDVSNSEQLFFMSSLFVIGNKLTKFIHSSRAFLSPYYERFKQLSVSGTGIGKTAVAFSILVISALILHTNVILSPFSNLNYYFSIFGSMALILIGHYFAARLSQDGRWKFVVFLVPFVLAGVLLIFTVISINPTSSRLGFAQIIGYLSIFELSLLGGVLSGDIKSAPWLGSALYLRHVQQYLEKEKIEFLLWDNEGRISLVNPKVVVPHWDERKNKVVVKFENTIYPFNQFTPVYVDGATNGKISSAINRVDKLFSKLPLAWSSAISQYKKSLDESVLRTSWLVIIQFVIPNQASMLIIQNNRVSRRPQRIKIGDRNYTINWKPPSSDWKESNNKLLNAHYDSPALHSALMTKSDYLQPLDLEIQTSIAPIDGSGSTIPSVDLLRSYTHLMISLYENISLESGIRSQICKKSIQQISSWYSDINQNILRSIISDKASRTNGREVLNSISFDDWNQIINDGLTEPTTKFLMLHDKLLNIIEQSKYSKAINGAIQMVISNCTEDIISSQHYTPGMTDPGKKQIRIGRQRDVGIKRKSNLLISICKMQLIYKLLDDGFGVEDA